MAPRIKLFQTAQQAQPKTIQMVLEDMHSAVLEIEASAIENPNIAPVNTPQEAALLEVVIAREEQEIEAVGEVIESSLPAIGALEDTAYAIAPSIVQTRPSDIALVRQIATTAADALGINPEELTKGVDDSLLGQPLVLEGFKEKAVAAARAVWNAILNLLDKAWSLFQSNFRRTAGRMKKLQALTEEISKNAITTNIKPTASMVALVTGNSLNSSEVIKGIDNILEFMRVCVYNMAKAKATYGKAVAVISKTKSADQIPDYFNEAALELVDGFAIEIDGSKIFKADGDDYVTSLPVNGSIIRIKGLAVARKHLKQNDPLEAVKAFTSVSIVMDDAKQQFNAAVEYVAQDFKEVAVKMGDVFKILSPGAINHVGGITREIKRNVQSMSDKVVSDWVDLIDKAPTEEQAALRPYLTAISQLVNKHASLTTAIYSKGISALDVMVTAGTQLLEQGVGGTGKKLEADDAKLFGPTLIKMLEGGDISRIRSGLVGIIEDNRRSYQERREVINRVEQVAPNGIFPPYETSTLAREIVDDKSKWDEDYYNVQTSYLNVNFAKKRFMHLIDVGEYLGEQGVKSFVPFDKK